MKKKIALLSCGWSSDFLLDFINGMSRATKDKNIDVYCFNAYDYTEFSGFPNFTGFSIFSLINYEEYDGIILLADFINNPRILEKERLRILKSGKPCITINKRLQGISCIKIDNYSASYEIMDHLIKVHGIKNFAYVGGKEQSLDIAERYKAYRTALLDNGFKINMEQVFTIEASEYNSAYNFFSEYMTPEKTLPEVFVCANDFIALAALQVAEERGIKIPDQLKIIGYDDVPYVKEIVPGITTVRGNADQVGAEAVNRVLNMGTDILNLKLTSSAVYRESCGCKRETVSEKKMFTLDVLNTSKQIEEFTNHMEHIEEIFADATDVFTLLTNLELFFNKTHKFEGNDFCIFLKSDWSSVLINSVENLPQNLTFGNQMQSITSIQDNKKYPREMINTKDLLPAKMKTDESSIFLFMPIFHHSYVHGYFVSKNNISMIDHQFGYKWTITFGTNIERFRKRNMYKQMSQQYFKLSTRDALSGMLNRVGMDKLAKPFYAQNKKNGLTTVLFFVDINSMKTINDKFGHLHGDLAVKTIAAAAMEVVPKNWLCIRYGGDEFLVLGNSHNYNGEDYCTLIKQRVQQKTSIMQLPYNLSASVGTYSVPPNSDLTLEQAVEKVDEIMYEQKKAFHLTH